MSQRCGTAQSSADRGTPAFTIMELLIVMVVITIVISILLPTMGIIRDTARAASTNGLMNNVITAVQRFSVEHKRQPGYFSARALGDNQNALTQGMSAGENVMLDLAQGIVGKAPAAQPANTIKVNPTTDTNQDVYVDIKQIGTGGAYFVPPPKYFVAQTNDGPSNGQQVSAAVGTYGHTASVGVDSLPDLVDAWGQPLLFWVEDDSALAAVNPLGTPPTLLAMQNAPAANQPGARIYWASNAAFLRSDTLGKKARNQTYMNTDTPYSLIGGMFQAPGVAPNGVRSLESALGNPNFAWKPATPPPVMEHPALVRAPLTIHSAGADGIYLSSKDKGAKKFLPPFENRIDYNFTFWSTGTIGGPRNTDKNGNPTNEDVLSGFDDVITTAAN